MNGLMWFIYLANVLPGLAFLGMTLVFVSFVLMFMMPPKGVEMFSREHPGPLYGVMRKEPWVVGIIGAFLALVTPDQETIYMMAGAKGAEIAVESEAGQEILEDIQEVIKFQLGELKGTATE